MVVRRYPIGNAVMQMQETMFATLFCKGCIHFERHIQGVRVRHLPWCKRYEIDINGKWCGTIGGVLTEAERIELKDW